MNTTIAGCLVLTLLLCSPALALAVECDAPGWERAESGSLAVPATLIHHDGSTTLYGWEQLVTFFFYRGPQDTPTAGLLPSQFLALVRAGEGGVVDRAVTVRVDDWFDPGTRRGRKDDIMTVTAIVSDSAPNRLNALNIVLCAGGWQ